jgi:hypothetical protein
MYLWCLICINAKNESGVYDWEHEGKITKGGILVGSFYNKTGKITNTELPVIM